MPEELSDNPELNWATTPVRQEKAIEAIPDSDITPEDRKTLLVGHLLRTVTDDTHTFISAKLFGIYNQAEAIQAKKDIITRLEWEHTGVKCLESIVTPQILTTIKGRIASTKARIEKVNFVNEDDFNVAQSFWETEVLEYFSQLKTDHSQLEEAVEAYPQLAGKYLA